MSDIDWAALRAVFPAEEIHWRVGSTNAEKTRGMALAYIDARAVMDRLDAVVGPQNWRDDYSVLGETTICRLSLRVGDEWITKADGAGNPEFEPDKGAISDALKRAAVKWGIGRYLYSLPGQWVEIANGRFKVSPKLPAWALPVAEAPPAEHLNPAQLKRFRTIIRDMATTAGPDRWAAACKAAGYDEPTLAVLVGREETKAAYTKLQTALEDLALDGATPEENHEH